MRCLERDICLSCNHEMRGPREGELPHRVMLEIVKKLINNEIRECIMLTCLFHFTCMCECILFSFILYLFDLQKQQKIFLKSIDLNLL